MPKLKTKSAIKKRARMTAGGLVKVRRQGHEHNLRKRAKRSLRAGRKVQYVNENMTNQIKKLAPYGLRS
ncbi:MAG: 50S ribosomal protein L35 [Rickettsiales bacterium]|jgi:large subunit ribosomal protein L35|nr:50S ribosomal protein L35 [Rickettsiales bacterium]